MLENTDQTNELEPTQEQQKAVEAVENSVAISSEEDDQKSEEVKDYSALSMAELVTDFETLLKAPNINDIKQNVNALKDVFNTKFAELLATKKAQFLEEGGNSIDFRFELPEKKQFNALFGNYKKRQQAAFKEREQMLQRNLALRNDLIDELKQLIDNKEAENNLYPSFKSINERWKTIGPVPRATYNDTWKIYHHHVERFYDLLHMRNDLRDLDFKHNLEEKLKLIAKVEELAQSEDVNNAFKQLQKIHKRWKEDIGPVPRDVREKVWQQFSEATKKVHDRKQEYYDKLKDQYQDNIDKKLEVIAQIQAFDTSGNKSHNDWQKSIKAIEAMREQFFAIGRVPKSKSDEIWEQFKNATKKFNSAKNTYYKSVKSVQQDNLAKKRVLIERAEAMKDSDDWQVATDVMKQVQAEWKKIGHVPKHLSDKMWKQFKGACNHYFDRLHQRDEAQNEEAMTVFKEKEALLEKLTSSFASEAQTIDSIKATINDWRNLGRVPKNKRSVEDKFNKLIDNAFEKLSIDKKTSDMMKFRNKVDSYLQDNDAKKLNNEIQFLRKKIDESVKETQLLENNISFISNAKNDNPLVNNLLKKIDRQKEQLDTLKDKLSYLRSLDY